MTIYTVITITAAITMTSISKVQKALHWIAQFQVSEIELSCIFALIRYDKERGRFTLYRKLQKIIAKGGMII